MCEDLLTQSCLEIHRGRMIQIFILYRRKKSDKKVNKTYELIIFKESQFEPRGEGQTSRRLSSLMIAQY